MLGSRGRSSWIKLVLACVRSIEVSFLLRLILYGGSGLNPSNAIKQNGRTTRRRSCSWKSPSTPKFACRACKLSSAPEQVPRRKQPDQADMCALSDRFWYSKQIKPGTGWNISLFNRGLCGWHRQNVKHKRSNRFLRRSQNCPQWLFCSPSQNPSEPVDTFIQDLYCLAEKCEYRTLRDELIRDRIIAGVLDDALSDRPQAGFDLNLTDAACMSRQTEARKPNRTICPWVRNSKRKWLR